MISAVMVWAVCHLAAVPAEGVGADASRLLGALRVRDPDRRYLDAADRLAGIGVEVVPLLEAELLSQDHFARQMAAHVLREIDGYAPSERMLWVTVEGLGADDVPSREETTHRGGILVYNAREGVTYLLTHAGEASALLKVALESKDGQRQFLAAAVIASARVGEGSARAVEILAGHLRSNEVHGDAAFAEVALGLMSASGIAPLLEARTDADEQALVAIERVVRRIQGEASPGDGPAPASDGRQHLADALDALWNKQMLWGLHGDSVGVVDVSKP